MIRNTNARLCSFCFCFRDRIFRAFASYSSAISPAFSLSSFIAQRALGKQLGNAIWCFAFHRAGRGRPKAHRHLMPGAGHTQHRCGSHSAATSRLLSSTLLSGETAGPFSTCPPGPTASRGTGNPSTAPGCSSERCNPYAYSFAIISQKFAITAVRVRFPRFCYPPMALRREASVLTIGPGPSYERRGLSWHGVTANGPDRRNPAGAVNEVSDTRRMTDAFTLNFRRDCRYVF